MSWFQSTNLASFAKTALKEAQKTIDKALDINEVEDGGANSGQGSRNTAVAAAVTDMASEFFASWGVQSSKQTPTDSENSSGTPAGNNSSIVSSSTVSPTRNRAISNPIKRTSSANNLSQHGTEEFEHSAGSSMNRSLTSDVPVTLLAATSPLSGEQDVRRTNDSNTTRHTRSLSDTVFHSSESDNLGELVQVLDDTSAPEVTLSRSITLQPEKSKSLAVNRSPIKNIEDSVSCSEPPLVELEYQPVKKESEKSNLELLQEIDLDGGGGTVECTSGGGDDDVISSTYPNEQEEHHDISNVVESSLSDGWDWTSATESGLSGFKKDLDEDREEASFHQDPAEVSNPGAENEPDVNLDSEECLPTENIAQSSSSHELDASVETIKQEQEIESTDEKQLPECQDVHNIHEEKDDDPSQSQSLLQTSFLPESKLASSRPSSCRDTEETPPSSARVSPNFEMVSSGCVVSSTQPESSRSSSIVVVSGRESTPHSSGSGGSSGSSEGGHDVEGEIPQSPIQTAVTSSSITYPRGKHKKGASSSSSSDIEVIPSDYSSSSAAVHAPGLRQSISVSHSASQTEEFGERRDREVQTEEVDAPPQEPKDLSSFVTAEVADILAEKDQEVQQLREEGEKLSIKQHELGQVIKKLRAKEKETDGVVKGLRTEIATKNLELEKLMKTFISKEGIEQSQNDTISKLNQERRKLELKVEQLSSELEDATDNVESMKATVENASIEILELKNVISSVQRESAEVDRLTRDKAELISRTESLQKEVEHLRSVLNSSHKTHHSQEAELKSQISQLTQKSHMLETRLADISSEVADATMPLSMEIEKLQGELKQQHAQADRREQSLQSQISDLDLKLKSSLEKEKSAKDFQIQFQVRNSELELRIEDLEMQNKSLRDDMQQKEEIFTKKLEDKGARCQKLEKHVERLTGEVERLASENDALSSELKTERNSVEVERRRSQTLIDQMNRSNNQPGQPNHFRSNSMSTSTIGSHQQHAHAPNTRNDNSPRSREHSPSEHSITSETSYLDEVFDQNGGVLMMGNGNNNRSMTPKSFFESFSSAGLMESLQNQLRLREGEAISFQEELSKNEKIRKQLNEEIANLTMQNQQLAQDMEKLTEMEQKLDALDKNYNAVLQMYGEKVEEADELRMDLEDVKEMYKTQIEQLLKKS